MFRALMALTCVLGISSFAAACDCSNGGSCQCGEVCGCGGSGEKASDGAMASPLANLVVPDLSAPTTVHVNVANFSFSTNVTIHIGDTVEWDWVSGTHTVTSVAGSADPFNSGVKSSGDFTHVFDVAGTFNYFCSIHGFDNGDGTAGGMSATVTVLPVPEPATVGLAGMGLAGLLMGRRVRKA